MSISINYDGVLLADPEPISEIDHGVQATRTKMLSGKTRIDVSIETSQTLKFKCYTQDQDDIDDLAAKIGGSAASLVVGTKTYANMKITGFHSGWYTSDGGWLWYEVEFSEHTA